MLRCENLELVQGDFRLTADVHFGAGVTAIMGPSGAGKSTLLAAIAGFLPVASGAISLDGVSFTQAVPGARPVGTLFQDNNLFPHLTIAQNVGLGLRPVLRLRADEQEQVRAILDEVGLNGMAARLPAALSGGQQSRAALARVLLGGRPVVLLDEPFAALGPGLKDEMLDLVRARLLAAGRIVVMVTHDPNDAKRIADQVAVVADGQVTGPRDTTALFADPPQALRAYLGAMG